MLNSAWVDSLPDAPGPERDAMVLEAVRSGLVTCSWSDVVSVAGEHRASFRVCSDALNVPLEDGSRFRVQVSATLAQQCADLISASLITSKVSDLAYQQAEVRLPVTTLAAGPDMVTTSKSRAWNLLVESKRAGREGLVRDCGKAWILSNQLNGGTGAVNYGFYDDKAPYTNQIGLRMWQCVGTRHDRSHTDYSQTLILMQSDCLVDGAPMKVADLMQDKDLCKLISYEGVMRYTRQPGVNL